MGDEKKTVVKRTGRPPKNPELGKRVNVMFRLNEARRDQLAEAAAGAGRSMSEEIEMRIEKSFSDLDVASSLFGGPETLMLARAISMLAYAIDRQSSGKWTQNPEAKADLDAAISRFMHIYFHEQGGTPLPSALSRLGEGAFGHSAAELVAEMLGLRSKARERMKAFLATPEGRAAWDQATTAEGSSD